MWKDILSAEENLEFRNIADEHRCSSRFPIYVRMRKPTNWPSLEILYLSISSLSPSYFISLHSSKALINAAARRWTEERLSERSPGWKWESSVTDSSINPYLLRAINVLAFWLETGQYFVTCYLHASMCCRLHMSVYCMTKEQCTLITWEVVQS